MTGSWGCHLAPFFPPTPQSTHSPPLPPTHTHNTTTTLHNNKQQWWDKGRALLALEEETDRVLSGRGNDSEVRDCFPSKESADRADSCHCSSGPTGEKRSLPQDEEGEEGSKQEDFAAYCLACGKSLCPFENSHGEFNGESGNSGALVAPKAPTHPPCLLFATTTSSVTKRPEKKGVWWLL